ncbi:MAG: hypothetical protein ACUVQ0_05695 [Thermoproteota archaeon]
MTIIISLLTYPQITGGNDTVTVTVVLRVAPWDFLAKQSFRVYVNDSSEFRGEKLSVSTSKNLNLKVPRGSYLKISGDLEVMGDYGFWYGLEGINGSSRSLTFKAERDCTIYINYSTNHVLTSPYFIAVYILLALLLVRRHITKTFKKQGI